jgi:universal stress protein E
MSNQDNRILAVIDPTRVDQWALQKALDIGKNRNDPEIYAYLCAHSDVKCNDPERLRAVETQRHEIWLEEILVDYSGAGLAIRPIVDWHADWREGVCAAAERTKAGLVIKRASGDPGALGNSDRRLIRGLEGSALFLVKRDPTKEMKNVLIAIDPNTTDSGHLALNVAITALGKRIRGDAKDIQLHSVSAYERSDGFKHPPDIAKALGISRAQAHVVRGGAAQVISETANNINADLVIVGNVCRRGLSGVTVGNTAEKILAGIESDVLVLVQDLDIGAAAA